LQHARALPSGVEEDLQDRRRTVAARPRDARRLHPHRAQRLRAVAGRPEMGAHPPGGPGLGEQPINVEFKLEVWDSPNSAGVVIDAIRSCKIAMDRGLKGALLAPS